MLFPELWFHVSAATHILQVQLPLNDRYGQSRLQLLPPEPLLRGEAQCSQLKSHACLGNLNY